MHRYVVIGAGAVGGTIGGLLAQSGAPVVLVARGAHLQAIASAGLHLHTPDGVLTPQVTASGGPEEITLTPDDVLILATKTHQAMAALSQWADAPVYRDGERIGTAGEHLPILTALNGVASEAMALRYFAHVYGVCLALPAVHLEPGEVIVRARPAGVLHIGPFPSPAAQTVPQVLATVRDDLRRAGFTVHLPVAVMAWKHRKLLGNIGNAFQALLGPGAEAEELITAARAEARDVLDHAGIDYTSDDEEAAAWSGALQLAEVPGAPAELGGSSWQSLMRGSGSIETDYLNGEIALIARRHGSRAPINTAVAALARQAARRGQRPGSLGTAQLVAELELD